MNPRDPRAFIHTHAPWLMAPDLAVCVVGSTALAEACQRRSITGPEPHDLDLSWALDVEAGEALLEDQGAFCKTTAANRARGTLAAKIAGRRIEITTFRDTPSDGDPLERIEADLAARDMTIGAVAWWLAHDRIFDPYGGVDHWRDGRVEPVGDPVTRIAEHPVRWMRYYRRAHQWGFALSPSVRRLAADPRPLAQIPPEALAQEFRAALLHCRSPGRLFLELYEAGLLQLIAPELALQFDGRPAGPIRHHPEVSQALHLILSLEWLHPRIAKHREADRLAAAIAVLCHDLGKGLTRPQDYPSHHGHDTSGAELIDKLLDRLPGLADRAAKRLAHAVARYHLQIRHFHRLRPGTQVDLYDRVFRHRSFPADLFALAVGADSGGRLDLAHDGDAVARQIGADIAWLRECCDSVDAEKLRARTHDEPSFRDTLRQQRAQALRRQR